MRYEGRMYLRGEITEACIEVGEDGKIERIKKSMSGCERLRGIILPGGIDMHVHFREPGATHKEDFHSGTLSAAFGGITFVADMPNNNPPITTEEYFEDKLAMVRGRANVDFTLFTMLKKGSEFSNGKNPLYKWYMYEDDIGAGDLPEGFITVHSELSDCISSARSLRDYDFARPESCERKAIRKLGDYGRRFHIAHVSSEDSVELCRIFGFTCEVTPHHLFLHRDMDLGAFGKVNPPLRAKWMADRLWDALVSGRIDVVASDHAPHTMDEKEAGFEDAPPGIPEVETYLPMFILSVKEQKISLSRVVEVLMSRPGELLGVKKGKIEVGYDADLIAVNFSDVRKIKVSELHYKCGWTPYEGHRAIFPSTVILRGEKIIEDGEELGYGSGKFISVLSGE